MRSIDPRVGAREAAPPPGRRVNVVGTCGSGKTTVGRLLAARLGVPFVEMDALSWQPNWTLAPDEEIRALVDEATRGDGWVIDGNYSRFRDIVWARADTVVWLDYRFPVAFLQLVGRTLRRVLTGEQLWNENRERLRTAFLSRDSILLWAIKTHRRRQREYPALLERSVHRRLRFVRLRSHRETEAWLARLQGDGGALGVWRSRTRIDR